MGPTGNSSTPLREINNEEHSPGQYECALQGAPSGTGSRGRHLDKRTAMNRAHPTVLKIAGNGLCLGLCALMLLVTSSAAQSSHAVSIQASVAVINSSNLPQTTASGTKLGWEGQLRIAAGPSSSIGIGYEQAIIYKDTGVLQSGENTETLQVAFIEPRFVVDVIGSTAALYLAGRAGIGEVKCDPAACVGTSPQVALGGGGGILIRLGGAAALDLGVQYFRFASSGSPTFLFLRGGLSVGL